MQGLSRLAPTARELPLEPPNLADLRLVTAVAVADPPNPKYKIDLDALPAVVEISTPLGEANGVVRPLTLFTHDDSAIALMDKPHPHALLEMMTMQAGRQVKSGIDELSEEELSLSLSIINQFARFVHQPSVARHFDLRGGLVRASFNYDPFTLDRPGLQPDKRFHAHMYLLDRKALGVIGRRALPYGALKDPFDKRRMVDPFSFLGAQLAYDLHRRRRLCPSTIAPMIPDSVETVRQGLPLGLNLELLHGWDTLTDRAFPRYLRRLHQAMAEATDELFLAFTNRRSVAPIGTRYPCLPPSLIRERLAKLRWLSADSYRGLCDLVNWLRPLPSTLLERLSRHPRYQVQHVTLNGLAYTISIAENAPMELAGGGALFLNIAVRMFANVGGAGLFGCRGVSAVMLDRGRGTLNAKEMLTRRSFQQEFQEAVFHANQSHVRQIEFRR
jgi:hypothetical protein